MKNSNTSAKSKYIEKLSDLKQKLATGDNFSDIYNYFFDHFGENNEFMRMSKKAKNPMIKKIISFVGEQLFKKKVDITHMMLLKFPKSDFYHGACFIDGKMGGVIFFKDIDMGMLSIVKEYPETLFIRFSTVQMETGDPVTVSPFKSKMIH
ncbi:MAG: DCN1-like protein [Desulfobacterales bacterium]|nr:DCN1-like protein [Desulfobacterales bacterium]